MVPTPFYALASCCAEPILQEGKPGATIIPTPTPTIPTLKRGLGRHCAEAHYALASCCAEPILQDGNNDARILFAVLPLITPRLPAACARSAQQLPPQRARATCTRPCRA